MSERSAGPDPDPERERERESGSAGQRPGRPGGAGALVRALRVPRNAAVGFGIGIVLAAYLLVGVFEGPAGQYSPVYYVGLGFVLAVGVGLLLTALFSLASAYRLSRSL